MVAVASDLERVQNRIVEVVRSSAAPYSPIRLIAELRGNGFQEDLIRAAVWFLIDAQRIDFTEDRRLRLPDQPEVEPAIDDVAVGDG